MMFREMRRRKQLLDDAEARAVLRRGSHGVLAVAGDEGWPYAVPLSYTYVDGADAPTDAGPAGVICFHCALTGHKVDAIKADERVSFCVVDADDVVPAEYATLYRSVIAFGRARIVDDEAEKERLTRLLGDKYNPGEDEALDAEISRYLAHMHLVAIYIEHLSGKQAKGLMESSAASGMAGANQ